MQVILNRQFPCFNLNNAQAKLTTQVVHHFFEHICHECKIKICDLLTWKAH